MSNGMEKGPPSLGVSPGGCGKGSVRAEKHATFRGSKMGLQRWFYDGGRPNWMARLLDRGTAALYARGVGPGYLVALEVPGRRSGRIVSLPLVVATVGGERYLVSMLGEGVNWVQNVRAAGGGSPCVMGVGRRCICKKSSRRISERPY